MYQVSFISDFEVFLSRRCAYSCGYCNFPQTPSSTPPSRKSLRALMQTAGKLGAHQMTLSAGEGIDQWDEITSASRYYGYRGWYDYIRGVCQFVLQRNGNTLFFPVLDIGPIPWPEMRRMRDSVSAVRLMLDSVDPRLMTEPAHRGSPRKFLDRRLPALETVCSANIPLVTGILVGIGECEDSWGHAARLVSDLHSRHGNVQSFAVKPYAPAPYSPMANVPEVDDRTYLNALRHVRNNLHDGITLCAEIGTRLALLPEVAAMGVTDIGTVCLGTSDRLNIDTRSAVQELMENPDGVQLVQRMTLADDFAARKALPEAIAANVRRFGHVLARSRGLDRIVPSAEPGANAER